MHAPPFLQSEPVWGHVRILIAVVCVVADDSARAECRRVSCVSAVLMCGAGWVSLQPVPVDEREGAAVVHLY